MHRSEDEIKQLYVFATNRLRAGDARELIKGRLIERGLETDEAERIAQAVADEHSPGGQASSGKVQLVIGSLLCVLGTAFTWGSVATSDTGGSVVILYGAIFGGAAMALTGLSKWVRSSRTMTQRAPAKPTPGETPGSRQDERL